MKTVFSFVIFVSIAALGFGQQSAGPSTHATAVTMPAVKNFVRAFYTTKVSTKTVPQLLELTGFANMTILDFKDEQNPVYSVQPVTIFVMEIVVQDDRTLSYKELEQIFTPIYRPATFREVLSLFALSYDKQSFLRAAGKYYILDALSKFGINDMPSDWRFSLLNDPTRGGVYGTSGADTFITGDKLFLVKRKEVL